MHWLGIGFLLQKSSFRFSLQEFCSQNVDHNEQKAGATDLSPKKQGRVLQMFEYCVSKKEIARRLNINLKSVTNIVQQNVGSGSTDRRKDCKRKNGLQRLGMIEN